MFLLDTNVLSELMKAQANSNVLTWLDQQLDINLFYCVVIDILPALKSGDSSRETAMSCRENVPSCVHITIMQRPTVGASPFSYSKSRSTFRTVDGNTSATRTRLGTVGFIDF